MKPTSKTSPPRGGPANSPNGGMPTSSPSSTDDMNSALLRSPAETDTSVMNNTMFGKFKGFTLRPLPNAAATTPTTPSSNLEGPKVAFVHPVSKSTSNVENTSTGVPIRCAPSAPKTANGIALDRDIKKIMQNGTLQHIKNTPPNTLGKNFITNNGAPALPPPNPGFHARPLISNPVLETSTCTAKEIATQPAVKSDQHSLPIRPAPIAPPVPAHADPSKFPAKKDGTIKRIASFLNKKEDKIGVHPAKVKPSIDRERLKTIEISCPIPFVNSPMDSDTQSDRTSINRSQSMKSPSKKSNVVPTNISNSTNQKPSLQSFGSMRQSDSSRPKSIVNNTARPKSPPPPRPPAPPANYKVPGHPRKYIENQYDDCEAVEIPGNEDGSNGDEIYSVIDERPPPPSIPVLPIASNKIAMDKSAAGLKISAGADDSIGLLGEIVNEIEKRNGDSIYSASTLRKKKSVDNSSSSTKYENTSDISPSDNGEAEYLKSNSSTSSGGYIRPSAINAPVARIAPSRPDISGTSKLTGAPMQPFSSFKPNNAQQQKVISSSIKTPTSPDENKKVPVFARTKTPPNLTSLNSVRKRSPSPVNTSMPYKNGSNVTASVKNTGAQKNKPLISPKMTRKNSQPTELTAAPTATIGAKKPNTNLPQKPKPLSKPMASATINTTPSGSRLLSNIGRHNSNPSSNNKIANVPTRVVPGKISAVASLQQKFETNSSNGTNKTSNGVIGKK